MNSRNDSVLERLARVFLSRGICGGAVLWAAALSCLLTAAPASAQVLTATPAVELRYTAGAGQVYELQGSYDLRSWRNVGDVVIGAGQSVSDLLPQLDNSDGYRFYRVKISPPREFGFAPAALYGKQIALNDEGDARVYSFTSRAGGSVGGEGIAYHYRMVGDTRAVLDVERGNGESEHIELEFAADLVGSYTLTTQRGGALVDVDRGTFSLRKDALPLRDQPSVTSIAGPLVGNSFVFSDGDTLGRFDFVTPESGRAVDGTRVTHFAYTYSAPSESANASVTLVFPGDLAIEFELEFGMGGCGVFRCRELVDGSLDYSSEGVFSGARSVYHTDGADSTDVTLPADELTGRTYVMRDGGTPCHLRFETLERGKCLQGELVDPIRYDYVINCNATSTVTVHLGSGDYDRYHLNHIDQTFLRHEVRGGVQVDSDTGSFVETP